VVDPEDLVGGEEWGQSGEESGNGASPRIKTNCSLEMTCFGEIGIFFGNLEGHFALAYRPTPLQILWDYCRLCFSHDLRPCT